MDKSTGQEAAKSLSFSLSTSVFSAIAFSELSRKFRIWDSLNKFVKKYSGCLRPFAIQKRRFMPLADCKRVSSSLRRAVSARASCSISYAYANGSTKNSKTGQSESGRKWIKRRTPCKSWQGHPEFLVPPMLQKALQVPVC